MKRAYILFVLLLITNLILAQSVDIKDSSSNSLIQINDEGSAGSITFPDATGISTTTNKLYNDGGVLKWDNTTLATSSSLWTLNSGNVYRSSGNVGIGTTTPSAKLEIALAGPGPWQNGIMLLNPDLASGEQLMFSLGTINDTKNVGNVYFNYAGDGLDENRLSFGLFGVNDVLNITANGKVGIGTTNPTAKLSVVEIGDGGDKKGITTQAHGLGTNYGIWSHASGGTVNWAGFFDWGDVYIHQKLGIGTTTPDEALHISNNLRLDGAFEDKDGDKGTAGQILSSNGNETDWIAAPSGVDGDWTISGSDMYSAVAGKVGIGITSPLYKLHVEGSAGGIGTMGYFKNNVSDNIGYGIVAYCNASDMYGVGGYFKGGDKGAQGIVNPEPATGTNHHYYGLQGTVETDPSYGALGVNYGVVGEAFYGITAYGVHGVASGASFNVGVFGQIDIMDDGYSGWFKGAPVRIDDYLGIGVTDPEFDLHIYSYNRPWGTNYTYHVKLEVENGWWTIGVDNESDDADFLFRSSEDSDGYTAYIDPANGSWAITSDKRYKKEIEPLSNILDKIEKLEPVSYLRLKQDNSERKELGFLAQDVNEVFPDYKVAKKKNDYWSLFYDNFGTIAIAGIKELNAEKDELEKQVSEQSEIINSLIKRIEYLESN